MRGLLRSAAVIAVLAVFVWLPAWAGTYSLSATDDVCVRNDFPHTAGDPTGWRLDAGGTLLSTNDYWTTYIKFSLSSFPTTGTLDSAKLKMTCSSHSSGTVNVSAYEMTSDLLDWSEYWVSQAGLDSMTVVNVGAETYAAIDDTFVEFTWTITAAARRHLGSRFTIVLKEENQPSNDRWVRLFSKDTSWTGYRPKLVLEYSYPEDEDPRAWINFSPTLTMDNLIIPDLYSPFEAYVFVDQVTEGLSTCSFALGVTPDISTTPTFESLLPGGVAIGDWETGITLASTECVGLGGEPIAVGVLHLFYIGGQGDIVLLDHPDYPRWVEDCQQPPDVEYYCVLSHGGVAKEPLPGDCEATPVQDTSWGEIKAMYR